MPRIILTISSPLFDEDQEVSIRENLPGRTLMAEILKEFNLGEGNYSLRFKDSNKPIALDKTLEQSGVQTGAALLFNLERRVPARQMVVSAAADPNARRPITGSVRAFVREESSNTVYEIKVHPAIIGRPDSNNPGGSENLSVNLGNLEASKSVSRHHARIMEQNGQYYLEAVAENNPTFLNGGAVRLGERRLLAPGDAITVGTITLIFGTKAIGDSTEIGLSG
ncbi:MAG TPA: FHA domain-containing protein [Aggregatilineales bacterium]|nr:FHA domain-containing protein [Aggregatilineales bacterium]